MLDWAGKTGFVRQPWNAIAQSERTKEATHKKKEEVYDCSLSFLSFAKTLGASMKNWHKLSEVPTKNGGINKKS